MTGSKYKSMDLAQLPAAVQARSGSVRTIPRRMGPSPFGMRTITRKGDRHQTSTAQHCFAVECSAILTRHANSGGTRLGNVCYESKQYGYWRFVKRGKTKRRCR